jgi:hypothetical protein
MPDAAYTSWVHGSSMQVEYLNRLTGVRHCGPFARIEGAPGQNAWVHFPIATPTVVEGKRLRAGAALLSFRTRSHATVHEVMVYDGEQQIAAHAGLSLQGDHLEARFEVPGSPPVNQGINITVGVLFSPQAPDVRSMQIEVVGAGMEFLSQASPASAPARRRAAARG